VIPAAGSIHDVARLRSRADELFVTPPSVGKLDCLAAKLPHPELTGV
jgi:hypothetical protein